jgi:hypothetical protein
LEFQSKLIESSDKVLPRFSNNYTSSQLLKAGIPSGYRRGHHFVFSSFSLLSDDTHACVQAQQGRWRIHRRFEDAIWVI